MGIYNEHHHPPEDARVLYLSAGYRLV